MTRASRASRVPPVHQLLIRSVALLAKVHRPGGKAVGVTPGKLPDGMVIIVDITAVNGVAPRLMGTAIM